MSTIKIRRPHTLGADEALKRIREFETYLAKYGATLKWKGHAAAIKGIGVSGDVKVSDRSTDIVVKLGMIARAAGVNAKRLEQSIKKRLDAAFKE